MMQARNIRITSVDASCAKPKASAEGMSGEQFDTPIHEAYGFSSSPEGGGESVSIDVNDDPNNPVALPAGGDRVASKGTTLVYHGDTTNIELSKDSVKIVVGDSTLTLSGSEIVASLGASILKLSSQSAELSAGGNRITVSATGVHATGILSADTDVRVGTTTLKTHLHTGNLGAPTTPAVT